jgi:phosphatidylglycerol:prolipoprotein diacylglycerol transferase
VAAGRWQRIVVAEPLIPYLHLPEIPLAFLMKVPGLGQLFDPAHPPSIKPFGMLVALGVYLGAIVANRRARERKLDPAVMSQLIFWVVAAGFIGGHMLDAVFYHPARILKDHYYILRLWDGLSSYGGFTGALIGAWLWRTIYNRKILPFGDVICSALPIGWMFGRAGCAVVHDHPGALSEAWFAVRYPSGTGIGFIGRFDLGLYECLLTIPLALGFAIAWRRDPFRPIGFYAGWMCVAYAPVRFLLDFFRVTEAENPGGGDPRYAGLTPAQWACFLFLGIGLYIVRIASKGARTEPPAEGLAPVPAADPTKAVAEAARVADDDDDEPGSTTPEA